VRRAALALVAGLVLAVGAPVGWLLLADRDPEQYGADAVAQLTAEPGSSGLAPGTVRTTSARLADVAPPLDPPVEVRFAGLTAPVDRVGLDADRQVVVPDDVRRAGWYEPGPAPGAPAGSAVLAGHVDDRTQGLGTFAGLRELVAGDVIEVSTAAGEVLVYDVVSLEQFPKAEAPMARLFAADGPHRLVLISCGGDFDGGSYTDNIVVTAVPRS
jgi:hypothetical protein